MKNTGYLASPVALLSPVSNSLDINYVMKLEAELQTGFQINSVNFDANLIPVQIFQLGVQTIRIPSFRRSLYTV